MAPALPAEPVPEPWTRWDPPFLRDVTMVQFVARGYAFVMLLFLGALVIMGRPLAEALVEAAVYAGVLVAGQTLRRRLRSDRPWRQTGRRRAS